MEIITSWLRSSLKISYAFKLSGFNIINFKPLRASRFMCYKLTLSERSRNVRFKRRSLSQKYLNSIVLNNPLYKEIHFSEDLLKENAESKNDLVVFLRNLDINDISNCRIDQFLTDKITEIDFTLLDLIETFHLLNKNREYILFSKKRRFLELLKNKGYNIAGSKPTPKLLILVQLIAEFHVKFVPDVYLKTVIRRYRSLTRTELIGLFHGLKYCKITIDKEEKFSFFNYMAQALQDFNMDELTVVAHGCFRCELRMSKEIGEILLHRLQENLLTLNELQVSEISKYVKFIGDNWNPKIVLQLHEKVFPITSKFSTTALTHLVNIRHEGNTANNELLDVIMSKFLEDDDPRMKDLERFLLLKLYVSCEVEDPKFLNYVIQFLLLNSHYFFTYPRSFVSLMNYLVYRQIYRDELINQIFSEEFLRTLYSRVPTFNGYELCSIDCCLELERPDYTGNRFPINRRNELLKLNHYRVFLPQLVRHFSEDIRKILDDMFGYHCTLFINALPHLPSFHVAMCFNENYEPFKIADLNIKLKTGHITYFIKNKWVIFVFTTRKCRPDGVNLNLFTQTKLRQLRALGFVVIEAKMEKQTWVQMTTNAKKEYLLGLLSEGLNVKLTVLDKCLDKSQSSGSNV